MKWFFHKKKLTVYEKLKEIFSDFKDKKIKTLSLFDTNGVILFSVCNDRTFEEQEVETLLNIFLKSEESIKRYIYTDMSPFTTNSNDKQELMMLKFGIYYFIVVRSEHFFATLIVDENYPQKKLSDTIFKLEKKLFLLEEKKIIEDY